MEQFLSNLLTASIHGSIVILAVILLRLLLRKTPKKYICLLWLLAGIRLLMPIEIRSDFSLQPQSEPLMEQILYYSEEAFPSEEQLLPVPAQNNSGKSSILPEFKPEKPAATEVLSPLETRPVYETRPDLDWKAMIPWAWLTVSGIFLVYMVFSYTKLRLLVREAVKIEGGWECDRIETAFILGFIRPQIYIPMGMSPVVRKHILAHERTHLEKGDHWYKMIGFIALALHWFNPLVWIAYILLCKDIELACDERVVQFMELPERKAYSAALLSCSANKAHFAACPVAFGEVSVKHRIKSVLNYKRPGFWISLAGVIAILFVAVCLVTSPAGDTAVKAVPGEVITVSSVDELLDAIGPDREIVMAAGTYNLSNANNYGKLPKSEYYVWEGSYDGYELVLQNVDNLTIRGIGKISTTLETEPRWANVLRVRNSTNMTLVGFTAGHTKDRGECSGGVLYLEGCNAVMMEDLGLYGCGVVGLTTELCWDVTLTGSDVYQCSSSAFNLNTSSNVTISGCRIYDIGLEEFGGYSFFEMSNCQNVTVDGNELSDSTLHHLLVSSGSLATFANNLFTGNRARECAFNIAGLNVVLDSNRFQGNTVRSWYSNFGSLALDQNGKELTEAVLEQMYPADEKQPTQEQLTIHAGTVDELIAAIGPNTEIILDGEFYDFSQATGYGTSSGTYYYWEDVHDGPGLVIRDVDNLAIRSNDGNVKNHTISAVPRYADVLAFSACSNVTLSGFTAGHTPEPGSCAGGVIEFRDCDNMTVDNCGLYGCGILGVYAEYSTGIQVLNSEIYECSQGGIQMRGTDNITISGNTFRDLGGDETTFSSCTNINLDGQTLNPRSGDTISMESEAVADEQDLHNMSEVIMAFANALFAGDEATMRLHLSSQYALPITLPEEVRGAALSANQQIPTNYPAEMESKGYCTVTVNYSLPVGTDSIQSNMLLEMCRENGIWRVQYYALDETEIGEMDRILWNFTYAYLEQDLEAMEMYLSEEYSGTVDAYFGSLGNVHLDSDYSIADSVSNAELAGLHTYSTAVPFRESGKNTDTYLNIVLRRRENPRTFEENGLTRREPEWEVLDYGIENQQSNASGIMDLPGGIQIETIKRENYTGTVMLIEDPSRVFLGTSTQDGFDTSIPGKRIGEMFEVYPETVAAVNAGAFFDDGTTSTAVGSYPLGLTIAGGKDMSFPGQQIQPGLAGFVGFNSDHKLLVFDHNLTSEEAKELGIRDGISIGPALIIHREIQPAAEENSGYKPRTAIGQREDGTVILLCINGRVFDSLGATYEEVTNEMMTYGAENACLLQGGSATAMMYHPNGTQEPELLTSVSPLNGYRELQPRRLPTYWMVAGE